MTQNNSPEAAQEDVSANSETKNNLSELQDATMEKIALDTADKANDQEWIQEQYNKKGNAFPKQMKLVADRMVANLQRTEWESRMDMAFEEQPQMQSSLKSIVKKLEMDVPDTETGHSPSHPYLANHPIYVKGWDQVAVPQYRITRDIYYDIDFLKQALRIKGIGHNQAAVIQELLACLERYAEHDAGRLAKELITKKQTNSYTSRAINKMGKITLALGFGAATLIAGTLGAVHMYNNGKKSKGSEMIPALGFAGLTIFIANPSLAKSLIGNQKEGALRELQKSVNKPAFKSAAKKYDLHGEPGENIATVMRSPDEDMRAKIDRCIQGTATEDDVSSLTTEVAKSALPQEQENIRAFWKDAESVAAISTVRQTRDKDAIDVENDFLRLGMGKFYRKAKDLEEEYKTNNEMIA